MVDARTATEGFYGKWYGAYGTAPCPVCQPEARRDQNALTLSDGQIGLLLHCKKSNCSYNDILAKLTGEDRGTPHHKRTMASPKISEMALRIWDQSRPIEGTRAENYLRNRAFTCKLPACLRFHSALLHSPTKRQYPALVARVDGGKGFAIHRTWLSEDGSCKAPADCPKMMLGRCSGGAVKLGGSNTHVNITEGIETALSVFQATGQTTWASLSASMMKKVAIPAKVTSITIFADGDEPGRMAAMASANIWHSQGRKVQIVHAPDGFDFNDVLRGTNAN